MEFLRLSYGLAWLNLFNWILVPLSVGCATALADDVPIATIASGTIVVPVEARRDIRFQRMRLEQGLSQTRVSHIVQDDQGFLWFGTQHGLNRFDGREFRLFKPEPGQPDSLSGVFIYALFKARDGTLWVGSDQGLDVFDPATETFHHIPLAADNPVVNHVSQDESGIVWLSTTQGLYRFDPGTRAVRRFQHDPADSASLSSNDIKSSGLDRQGTFWVATGEGLDAFDLRQEKVTRRIPLKESVREFYFHEDRAGIFWIVYGSGNGIAQYDRTTNTLTRFAVEGGQSGGSGLTGAYAVLEDHDGTIWIGTMGEGLLRYDRQRKVFMAYRHDPGSTESLAEDRVIALFEDSQRNIWVGLHAMPPNSFPAEVLPFERIVTPASDPKAIGETLVNTVFTDAGGILWVGAGGALGRIDRRAGESRAEVMPGGGPVEVLTILEHPVGTLWVGTLGRGLFRLDATNGEVKSYRQVLGDPTSLGSDIVTRVFIDRAGTMWLATWNGLYRFDPATGRSEAFKRNPQSAAEGYFSVAQDPSGDLWLGSTSGLWRFSPSTRVFQGYTHDPTKLDSLSNNTVNSVLVSASGMLWVGTQNGLNLFDWESGTFRIFRKADGLPGDVVSCLLEERPGILWMSTNNGLSRLDLATGLFTSFSIADGLPGNDLSGWNACHRAPSGEMVFGGFSGAVAFKPDQAAGAEPPPPVTITEVRLLGRAVPPASLRRADGARELLVPSSSNEFAVSYAALYFRNPSAVRFRYRLTGLDRGWHEVGSDQRVAGYAAIPPGTYRFEVEGRTARSEWIASGDGLVVRVLPPWWQTWWFRAAAFAALVGLAAIVYRLRLGQLRAQYAIRLEERLNERTRIARDIHDSLLQGVQALIFHMQAVRNLLPENPRVAAELLDVALDKADAAVVEGRETVNALRSATSIDQTLPDMLASLKDELTLADPPLPHFSLVVEGKPVETAPLVRDEIFQVVREAVRNAVKHARASRIELELTYARNEIRVRVRDDGGGMDQLATSGERVGHWGLRGMHERALRMGGRLALWSKPGAGTEVELVVPIPAKAPANGEMDRPREEKS